MSTLNGGGSSRLVDPNLAGIRKACDICHASKQKCSGEKPDCARCVKSGFKCIYSSRTKRVKAPVLVPGSIPYMVAKADEAAARRARHQAEVANGSAAGVAAMNFLTKKVETEAGPSQNTVVDKFPPASVAQSSIVTKSVERPTKKRKVTQNHFVNLPQSRLDASGSMLGTSSNVILPGRGQGGNCYVRRASNGREVMMTSDEFIDSLNQDKLLTKLRLERFIDHLLSEVAFSVRDLSPSAMTSPVRSVSRESQYDYVEEDTNSLDNYDIEQAIEEEEIVERSPGCPSHSDIYDGQSFEEEVNERTSSLPAVEAGGSPASLHFAVEESADMRFFARSCSMPPGTSLPPLDMSSFLALQASQAPSSPKSHYLTEGLDLAAGSSRTPAVSTFEAAYSLGKLSSQPNIHSTPYNTLPAAKPFEAESVVAPFASASVETPLLSVLPSIPTMSSSFLEWDRFAANQIPSYQRPYPQNSPRARSVPQSPFPTQHFGLLSHVSGSMTAVSDYGTPDPEALPISTGFGGGYGVSSVTNPILAVTGVEDMDVEGMLNTDLEVEENGVGQVRVTPLEQAAGTSTVIGNGASQEITSPPLSCHHVATVSHTLWALTQLEEEDSKLNDLLPQLTRSLEILLEITTCPNCSNCPASTISQLALLSRTCCILQRPHPLTSIPLPLIVAGGRATMTGIAPEIQVHIVDVLWTNWRGLTIRKICLGLQSEAEKRLDVTKREIVNQIFAETIGASHKKRKTIPVRIRRRDKGLMAETAAHQNSGAVEGVLDGEKHSQEVEPSSPQSPTGSDTMDKHQLRSVIIIQATRTLLEIMK